MRSRVSSLLPSRRPPWDERHRPPAPPRRPGDVVAPPTFVGVGVQKAGTTWWHSLIEDHPQCYRVPGAHKERHFFNRTFLDSMGPETKTAYAQQFPRPPGMVVGEWTPRYLYLPWAPSQLAQVAPDVRVLAILRDPIERLRSGIAHQLQRGKVPDSMELTAAIERGAYGRQVRRLYQAFATSEVLLLQYEQLRIDPLPALARTYRHIGVDPEYVPRNVRDVRSTTMTPKPELPSPLVERLRRLYREDMCDYADLFPDFDFSLWTTFSG